MAKHRKIDTAKLMQYELGYVPWAIAHGDGTLRTIAKSKLLAELEKDVPLLEAVPSGGTILVDAMALLQSFSSVLATFGELSSLVFDRLLSMMNQHRAVKIDLVADQYFNVSIKGLERARRSTRKQPVRMQAERTDQPTPTHWKRHLAVGANKTSLIAFFYKHWPQDTVLASKVPEGHEIFITVRQDCFLLTAPLQLGSKLRVLPLFQGYPAPMRRQTLGCHCMHIVCSQLVYL
eukprot:scpid79224/ scgid15683/ 